MPLLICPWVVNLEAVLLVLLSHHLEVQQPTVFDCQKLAA